MTEDESELEKEQRKNLPHVGAARIKLLNENLRIHGRGGTIVMSPGIRALHTDTIDAIMAAVRSFNDFNRENDPFCEHNSAHLVVEGIKVFWHIEYRDSLGGEVSEEPENPDATDRVLTVMLAEEW